MFDLYHTKLRKRDVDNIGYYQDDDEEKNKFGLRIFEAIERKNILASEEIELEAMHLDARRARGGRNRGGRNRGGRNRGGRNRGGRNRGGRNRGRKTRITKYSSTTPPISRTTKLPSSTPTTKSHHSTKTSSGTAKPSVACKVLYQRVKQEFAAEAQSNVLERRSETIFGQETAQLERRTSPKAARGCGVKIRAKNYPQRAEMPNNALVYGYSQPNVCLNFQFGSGPYHRRKRNDAMVRMFDVEHVLEWSTVTHFWDWMNKTQEALFPQPNPNPGKTDLVDFCEFWDAVWNEGPAIPIEGQSLKPNKHVANAFPSATKFKNEFTLLQDIVNQTPKQQMWAMKDRPGIFDKDAMKSNLAGPKSTVVKAREAMIKLKALLGAHSYMKTPHINQILGKQKSRIGKVLEAIDKELPNHPRVDDGSGQPYNPWNRIGLKNHWDRYMDMKFDAAVDRTRWSMETHLRQAEQRWIRDARNQRSNQQTPEHKELRDMIRAVAKRWRKDKGTWKRPASWGVKGGVAPNRHPKPVGGVGNSDVHLPAEVGS